MDSAMTWDPSNNSWTPSSSRSWTKSRTRLSIVRAANFADKEIGAIRHKADDKVAKETERLRSVQKKHQELMDDHQKRVKERLGDYNHQIETMGILANKEIHQYSEAEENARFRIEHAEQAAKKADAKARKLEEEVKRLYLLYEKTCAEHDDRLGFVRSETDRRVQSKLEESNRLVRETGLYATQVQAEAMQYISTLEGDKRVKMRDLEHGSSKRSRFKELYDVAVSRGSVEIPRSEFEEANSSILQDWHNSWQLHATGIAKPPESVTDGFREVSSSLSNHETIDAEDILDTVLMWQNRWQRRSLSPPDMMRSKERALSQASEHQRQQRDLNDTPVRERPKTAPGFLA